LVTVPEVGSSCDIQIRGKYPLFSEINFHQILTDSGYERKLDTKNDNQPYYLKDDTVIFSNFAQNLINLKLRNTISIQTKYDEFTTLLAKLGFKSESVSVMGGHFRTFVTDIGAPQIFLDKLLNEKVKTALSKKLQITPTFLSVVIANTVIANTDTADMDIQIRIEPLNSSPLDSLHLEVIFRTTKHDVFNDFVNRFGADFIKDIINTIGEAK